MSSRSWVLSLLAVVVVLGGFYGADRVAAGEGSVRFLTAGPVQLGDGHIAHMRVFLPAVMRPVRVHFVGEGGDLLTSVDVDPSAAPAQPAPGKLTPDKNELRQLTFDVSFTGVGGRGTLNITDGTSNTIHSGPSNGIIEILIGLRNGGGMGTLSVVDADGKPAFILPYIEQDNLVRR